jgi:hypothetical protein
MATLEYNSPEIMSSIIIPVLNSDTFPTFPKIKVSDLFKSCITTKEVIKANTNKNIESSTSTQESQNILLKSKNKHQYSNIIENLERKYCSGRFNNVNMEDDNEHDNTNNELDAETNTDSTKLKRRRKKQNVDYYDSEDSFIDDTDNISTIEKTISMKTVNTKQKGFFVSSGELEILPNQEPLRNVSTKEKSAHSVTMQSDITMHGSSSQDLLQITSKNSKVVSAPSLNVSSVWCPPLDVISAFDEFQKRVVVYFTSNVTEVLPLKHIPLEIKQAMEYVDNIVKKHPSIGSISQNQSKYVDKLMEIIGDKITVTHNYLKNYIKKIRLHTSTQELNNMLSCEEIEVVNLIRSRIEKNKVNSDSNNIKSGVDSSPNVNNNADKDCEYVVKWDSQSRSKLLELSKMKEKYIKNENDLRKLLTQKEKSVLKEEDVSIAIKYLYGLCVSFYASY